MSPRESPLRADDPEWIQRLYLQHMEVFFPHRWFRVEAAPVAGMFLAVERLPAGAGWIERNRSQLAKLKNVIGTRSSDISEADQLRAEAELTNVLQRLGVDPAELENTGLKQTGPFSPQTHSLLVLLSGNVTLLCEDFRTADFADRRG
ncbi:MAG: hypothetical protein FJ398_09825 [Verrucomicrobia bacterium]|nr:hypothetical protein [Verrucomicrobiota bacterium]